MSGRTAIEAETMVELKKKLRRKMGWPDRRTWTPAERDALNRAYDIKADWARGKLVATPITK